MKLHLKHLEYEILDHCNLKCQNCSKFSYLKPKKNLSLEQIKYDFENINKRFILNEFTILGGEPLLHPEINGILLAAYNIFKKHSPFNGLHTKLKLVSNGTTLLKKDIIFFNILKTTKILLEVSKYDLNLDYNKMLELSRIFNFKFRFIEKPEFNEFLDVEGKSNPDNSFKTCKSIVLCPNYRDGKVFTCSYSYASKFLVEKNIIPKQAIDQGIDINSTNEEFLDYLNKPVPTCTFCKVEKLIMKPWKLVNSKN